MSVRSGREWLALAWVALVVAVVVTVVTTFVGFTTMPRVWSPFWGAVWGAMVFLPPLAVGVVVGAVAGVQRWWLVLPAVCAVLGALAAGALAAWLGFLPIFWVAPGLAAESLLAVALLDLLDRAMLDRGARRRASGRLSRPGRP